MEVVQYEALPVDGRLRRVQVLRLVLRGQHASAEADDLRRLAVNRKHQPAAEPVEEPRSVLAFQDQSGGFHVGGAETLALEASRQVLARAVRVAQSERLGHRPAHLPLLQILAGRGPSGAVQVGEEGAGREFVHCEQRGAQASLVVGLLGLLRHGDAVAVGQQCQGFIEAQPLDLHDEFDDVPAGVAAETLVELVRLVDGEGRRLLGVERAQARIARPRARLLQAHVLADHFHDVDGGFQLLDEIHGFRTPLFYPQTALPPPAARVPPCSPPPSAPESPARSASPRDAVPPERAGRGKRRWSSQWASPRHPGMPASRDSGPPTSPERPAEATPHPAPGGANGTPQPGRFPRVRSGPAR